MSRKEITTMLVEVKVFKVQGQATIVTFRDKDGMVQARIISRDEVPGLRLGEAGMISSRILESGTDYGIDWEVFLGDSGVIKPTDIEQEFRKRGLWTYEDINKNSPQVMAALNARSGRVLAQLMSEARKVKLETI